MVQPSSLFGNFINATLNNQSIMLTARGVGMKRKYAQPITPWEALQEASKVRDRQAILDKAVSKYLLKTTENNGVLPLGGMKMIIMSLGAQDWLTRDMIYNKLKKTKKEKSLLSEVVKKIKICCCNCC